MNFRTLALSLLAFAQLTSGAAAASAPPIAPEHYAGDVVAAWNETAYEIAYAEDQFLTFKGLHAFAMMHLAMHDALNAIVPVFEPYAFTGARRDAEPVAAVAQAAYAVLLSWYPDARAQLDDALAAWLDPIEPGRAKRLGIALGNASATAIVRARAGDRWDVEGHYEFRDRPGQYQTTPPWDGFVAQPGFRHAKPFALETPAQVRPSPPPALSDASYAAAYGEVKDFGAADSNVRSDEQTDYALWWMEYAEGSINRLARQVVASEHTDLWLAARLFAHLNVSLYDAYVAVWDSKFEYNHWRPYTAIREAGDDGNPATVPDTDWEPLRETPPFPEYVSAHAAGCAASLEVLRESYTNDVAFTMETITAPPGMPTRSFTSFSAAAAECADSRVMLGFHFRYSTDAGHALGVDVARYVAHTTLRKRDGS